VVAENGNRQKIKEYAYTIDLGTKIPNEDVEDLHIIGSPGHTNG